MVISFILDEELLLIKPSLLASGCIGSAFLGLGANLTQVIGNLTHLLKLQRDEVIAATTKVESILQSNLQCSNSSNAYTNLQSRQLQHRQTEPLVSVTKHLPSPPTTDMDSSSETESLSQPDTPTDVSDIYF